jgi:hypothetical protein
MNSTNATSAATDVARCQQLLAHAWMVRTFVKHSPEVEEFPELMGIVRSVFDLSRALETQVDDPPAYFQMLYKKLSDLEQASRKFAHDAPLASTHTNFQQAVVSIATCVADLREILTRNYTPPAPPPSRKPGAPARPTLPPAHEQPVSDLGFDVEVEVQEEVLE